MIEPPPIRKERGTKPEIGPDKVVVIPNGIDTKYWHPIPTEAARERLGLPMNMKIVLFVGRLEDIKGTDILIESLTRIRKRIKNTRLYIVGEGTKKEKFMELSKELGVQEHVIFLGYVENDELVYWYNACDVFVLPSKFEAFGIVVIQAMACSKPVVATISGGPSEVVLHGKTGFLVDYGDTKALSNAIIQVLEDEELGRRMGEEARKRVLNNYNWNAVATKTTEIYRYITS